jgi:hypothetical protein
LIRIAASRADRRRVIRNVQVNGLNATLVRTVTGGENNRYSKISAIYILQNPTPGTVNIVVSFDSNFEEGYIQIDNLKNVKALAPIGNTNAAFTASTTISLIANVVKSDPLSLVVAVAMWGGTGGTGFEPQPNQIEEFDGTATASGETSRILIAKNLVDGNIKAQAGMSAVASSSLVVAEILPG